MGSAAVFRQERAAVTLSDFLNVAVFTNIVLNNCSNELIFMFFLNVLYLNYFCFFCQFPCYLPN